MKWKEWGAFWLLGLVWGSSFLWIKIAVQDVGPFTLVAFRLLFGLAGLLVLVRLQRQPFPRERRILLAFAFMGIFQTALPFVLISWGETRIDSSLAAILDGTVPLFTILISHFWLHDEKLTLPRVGGLLVGFAGVVTLMSRGLSSQALESNVAGQLAVLSGSTSYAVAATFSRRYLRDRPPLAQSTAVVFVADSLLWLATPIAERPFHLPSAPITWFALAWLGLLGVCLAYQLYFYLLNQWGATRTSLVTYVLPAVGLVLGIVFLREAADWRLIAGSILVVAGIAVVNPPLTASAPAAAGAAE